MKLSVKNLVATAMLVAAGLLLPTLFHTFGGGPVMLPMHIPVLLCGLICGVPYGALCGIILPFLSSFISGMPPIFPTAVAMAFERCTYGVATGLLYRALKQNVYFSLIGGMLAGRVVSGIVNAFLMGVVGNPYGLSVFLTSAFVTGLPGIAVQLIFIPVIVLALTKAGFVEKPRLAAV